MTGDNWGQIWGQIGDTGDIDPIPTGDTGDNPPRRDVPCPRKEALSPTKKRTNYRSDSRADPRKALSNALLRPAVTHCEISRMERN
jgi:hypothetical protein